MPEKIENGAGREGIRSRERGVRSAIETEHFERREVAV